MQPTDVWPPIEHTHGFRVKSPAHTSLLPLLRPSMKSRRLRLKRICESLELLLPLGQLSDTGFHPDGPLYGGEGAEGMKHRHLHRPTVSPPANQMEQQHSLPPKLKTAHQRNRRGCGHKEGRRDREAVGMREAGWAERLWV